MTKADINAKFGAPHIDMLQVVTNNINKKERPHMVRRISYDHLMKLREELKTTYRTGQGRQDVFNALELAADYIDLLEARQEFLIKAMLKFARGDEE